MAVTETKMWNAYVYTKYGNGIKTLAVFGPNKHAALMEVMKVVNRPLAPIEGVAYVRLEVNSNSVFDVQEDVREE